MCRGAREGWPLSLVSRHSPLLCMSSSSAPWCSKLSAAQRRRRCALQLRRPQAYADDRSLFVHDEGSEASLLRFFAAGAMLCRACHSSRQTLVPFGSAAPQKSECCKYALLHSGVSSQRYWMFCSAHKKAVGEAAHFIFQLARQNMAIQNIF